MDFRHRVQAFGSGGSFWQAHLDKAQLPLSKLLASLGHDSALPAMFMASVAGWSNLPKRPFAMRWLPCDDTVITAYGGGLNQRQHVPPAEDQWIVPRATEPPAGLEGEEQDPAVRDAQPVYWVTVPPGVLVLQVAGKLELLTAGTHFSAGPGWMFFPCHPEKLLSGPNMLVVAGVEALAPWSDYSMGADLVGGDDVAAYYRKTQTPGQLLKAACAAAGLSRVAADCTVTSSVALRDAGRVYRTDTGLFEVPYTHAALADGTVLLAGTYVGASPEVLNAPGSWWTTAPWGSGLSMRSFSPWNLYAPNALVKVDFEGSDLLRARMHVQGDQEDLDAWWAACRAGEDATGVYLADVLGMGPSEPETWVNPLHVFAEHVWGDTALVVTLGASGLDPAMLSRMRSFLQRERPFGTLLLTLD